MSLLSKTHRMLRAFRSDTRGAAGVEFLMTLPLLIGAMVFTAEYGKALRARMLLNSATADAARLLANSPLQQIDDRVLLYPEFTTVARETMEARLQGTVDLTATVQGELGALQIVTTANVGLEMPLLNFINQTLEWAQRFDEDSPTKNLIATEFSITSQQTEIWSGASALDASAIPVEEIENAACAGDLKSLGLC